LASIKHCPVCVGTRFTPIYHLPKVPIFCNQFWPTKSDAMRAVGGVLDIVQCDACSHVVNAAFDADQIEYAAGYENSLHFSPTFGSYAEELATRLVHRYGIRGKKILEIGCGDGDFLIMLCEKGRNQGFGFDPSQTDRRVDGANGATVTIRGDYYVADTRIADVDVICSRHVLEHLSDPGSLLRSLRDWHKNQPGAIAYFEVPNGDFCLKPHGVWDLIYEHVSYFTPQSLSLLLRACGYRVLDTGLAFGEQFLWAEVDFEGGSDTNFDLAEPGTSERIRAGYEMMIETSQRKIETFAARGFKMALWGAGSKGVTFLNIADSARSIDTVVDINPRKQSHYVALTGQKVVAPEELPGIKPDIIFVMNSVYIREIAATLDRLGVRAELISVHDLLERKAA
jgi:SAM-dependent methyltransferase